MMTSEGAAAPSIITTAKNISNTAGFTGFYRGLDSNILRAMVLNGTKMSCYDTIKGVVVDKTGMSKGAVATQAMAAAGAGFFMTCTVAPFDMVRTRLMNQPPDAKVYSNAIDCFTKVRTERMRGAEEWTDKLFGKSSFAKNHKKRALRTLLARTPQPSRSPLPDPQRTTPYGAVAA